jgi:hypothetical protein
MSEIQQTAEEVFDSLTGFDEIAIAQQFGRTVSELAAKDQSMFGRALVFVVRRRDGLSDVEARDAALGLTMKGFTGFFAETSAEESGKDEPPVPQPEPSLTSAL